MIYNLKINNDYFISVRVNSYVKFNRSGNGFRLHVLRTVTPVPRVTI